MSYDNVCFYIALTHQNKLSNFQFLFKLYKSQLFIYLFFGQFNAI